MAWYVTELIDDVVSSSFAKSITCSSCFCLLRGTVGCVSRRRLFVD